MYHDFALKNNESGIIAFVCEDVLDTAIVKYEHGGVKWFDSTIYNSVFNVKQALDRTYNH